METNIQTSANGYTELNKHTDPAQTTISDKMRGLVVARWERFQCDMTNEEFRELTSNLTAVKVAGIMGATKSQVMTYRRFKSPARVPKVQSDRLRAWLKTNIQTSNKNAGSKVSFETFDKLTQGMTIKDISVKSGVKLQAVYSWRYRRCNIPLEYVQKLTCKPIDDSLILHEPTYKPHKQHKPRRKQEVPDVEPLSNKEFRKLAEGYTDEEIAEYVKVTVAKVERWKRRREPCKISAIHTDRILDFIVYKRTGVDMRELKKVD